MTPAFYRSQAKRFREIAGQQVDTELAKTLTARADEQDHAADLLIELNKINAALARATERAKITRAMH